MDSPRSSSSASASSSISINEQSQTSQRKIPEEVFRDPKLDQEERINWDHDSKKCLLGAFECCVCYNLPVQRTIWACLNGHPICTHCMWNLKESKCPSCRDDYFTNEGRTLKENKALSRLYNGISVKPSYNCVNYPCPSKNMTLEQGIVHEDYCQYQIVPCPLARYFGSHKYTHHAYSPCDHIVGVEDLLLHLDKEHSSAGFSYYQHKAEGIWKPQLLTLQFQFSSSMGRHKRPHIFTAKKDDGKTFVAFMYVRTSKDYQESSYGNKEKDKDGEIMFNFSIFVPRASLKENERCRYHLGVSPYGHDRPLPEARFGMRTLEGEAAKWKESDLNAALHKLKVMHAGARWEIAGCAKDSNYFHSGVDELNLSIKTLRTITNDTSFKTYNGTLFFTLSFGVYNEDNETNIGKLGYEWLEPTRHSIHNSP